MDAATKSLNHVEISGDYYVFRQLPIFDEHDEHDHQGKLVRRFDVNRLKKIAEVNNRRVEKYADMAKFGPGHTKNDGPENEQPPAWGFVKNFKVDRYGPEKVNGLVADFYVKKRVLDGREFVDGKEYFLTYPSRSIEIFSETNEIDWVAITRRAAARPLGSATEANCYHRKGKKIYYSKELYMPVTDNPADVPPAMNAPAIDPALVQAITESVIAAMIAKFPGLADLEQDSEKVENDATVPPTEEPEKYEAAGFPSATNTYPPSEAKVKKEKEDYSKGGDPDRYTQLLQDNQKMAKHLEELSGQVKNLSDERSKTGEVVNKLVSENRLLKYTAVLEKLNEKYEINVPEELKFVMSQGMDETRFAEHCTNTVIKYQRKDVAPVNGPMITGSITKESPVTREIAHRAAKDASNGLGTYDELIAKYKTAS